MLTDNWFSTSDNWFAKRHDINIPNLNVESYQSPLNVECVEVCKFTSCIYFRLNDCLALPKHRSCQNVSAVLSTDQVCSSDEDFSTLLQWCSIPQTERFLTSFNCL